jgi:hypothetical protein
MGKSRAGYTVVVTLVVVGILAFVVGRDSTRKSAEPHAPSPSTTGVPTAARSSHLAEAASHAAKEHGALIRLLTAIAKANATSTTTTTRTTLRPTPPPTPAPTTTPTTPPCFTGAQAFNEIGQIGCVKYTVGSTYTSERGEMYLDQYSDYTSGFSAWIPAGYSFGPALLTTYANQTIIVSGTITSYEGAPEIVVTDPSQVRSA